MAALSSICRTGINSSSLYNTSTNEIIGSFLRKTGGPSVAVKGEYMRFSEKAVRAKLAKPGEYASHVFKIKGGGGGGGGGGGLGLVTEGNDERRKTEGCINVLDPIVQIPRGCTMGTADFRHLLGHDWISTLQ